MASERWSDDRLDDLAQQVRMVAAMTTMVATHDAKIDGVEDDIQAIRDAHREALKAWSTACDAKVDRLERKIDHQAHSREWTLSAKLTLFAALFGPLASAILIVLTKGG